MTSSKLYNVNAKRIVKLPPAPPNTMNPIQRRKAEVDYIVNTMLHAVQCKLDICYEWTGHAACLKMKRIIAHTKDCRRNRMYQDCPYCRLYVSLCFFHAKRCLQDGCRAPFCAYIKEKLKTRPQQH